MLPDKITQSDNDAVTFTLTDAVGAVDRERILMLPAQPLTADCATCLPGDLAPAEVLLRYTDLRLRRRRRRVPLCRRCWTLEIVRVLGEPVADVRVLVPRHVAEITVCDVAGAVA